MTTIETMLSLEQRALVDRIASGAITTYSEWFIDWFCTRNVDEMVLPPGVQYDPSRVPKDAFFHIGYHKGGTSHWYFLRQSYQYVELSKALYEFMGLLAFLVEHELIILRFSASTPRMVIGSQLTNNGFWKERGTLEAVRSIYDILSGRGDDTKDLLYATIVVSPQIRGFVADGHITLHQQQMQAVADASNRADRANRLSLIIAGSALAASLIGVLVQACGSTDVHLRSVPTRVTTVPIYIPGK